MYYKTTNANTNANTNTNANANTNTNANANTTHKMLHLADPRTQRRLNRNRVRDQILKKEQKEREKRWIREEARRHWIESATKFQPLDSTTWPKELTFDQRYIARNNERIRDLAFTDEEKKLLEEARNRERAHRQMFDLLKWPLLLRKIHHNVAFTEEWVRANTTLLRDVCADYKGTIDHFRSKVDDLERQLKEANDQIKSMAGGL